MFAGSPGLPALSRVMGEVAIEQGRIDQQGRDVKSLEHEDDLVRGKIVSSYDEREDEADSPPEDAKDAEVPEHSPEPFDGVDLESSIAERQQRKLMRAVRTSPDLSFPRKGARLPRFSDDPLGQLDPITPPAVTQSVPSLPAVKRPHQPSSSSASEVLLNRYDFGSQIHLLRCHFCRSEVCKHLLASI
jgi:phosphatidylinositol 4-kinase